MPHAFTSNYSKGIKYISLWIGTSISTSSTSTPKYIKEHVGSISCLYLPDLECVGIVGNSDILLWDARVRWFESNHPDKQI